MKKLYYAYVAKNMIGKFEDDLEKRKDKIKVVLVSTARSKRGESVAFYVLEAEEGIINSKWELK